MPPNQKGPPPRGSCVECGRPSPGKPQCYGCYRKHLGPEPMRRTGTLAESMNYPPQARVVTEVRHVQVPVYVRVPAPAPQVQAASKVAGKKAIQLQVSTDGLTWFNVDRVDPQNTGQVRMVQQNADGSETILPVRGSAPTAPAPRPVVAAAPTVSEATTRSVVSTEEDEQVDRFMLIELD
jgi:hypothetical protein